MLAAILCTSESSLESQRLKTALRWTSEEARRMGVQLAELTQEAHGEQLRGLNVKVYPTLIVYRRSADGERLELADALRGESDPVSVYQWLKRTAENHNSSKDSGLHQTGVGPDTLVPISSGNETRPNTIMTVQPRPPLQPMIASRPEENAAPSASVPIIANNPFDPNPSEFAGTQRLNPEVIANAGQPPVLDPDLAPELIIPPASGFAPLPPRNSLLEPNGEHRPAPNPSDSEPNPTPVESTPRESRQAATQPDTEAPPAPTPDDPAPDSPDQAPAPVPPQAIEEQAPPPAQAQAQPQTQVRPTIQSQPSSAMDDPRYQTPPHLVGRSISSSLATPQTQSAPTHSAKSSYATASPQSPPPSRPHLRLEQAFVPQHSPSNAQHPHSHQDQHQPKANHNHSKPIAAPSAPELSAQAPPQKTAPAIVAPVAPSAQASLVYRQQVACVPTTLPPAPTCEIPRSFIIQTPVSCPPGTMPALVALTPQSSAPPTQLFLAPSSKTAPAAATSSAAVTKNSVILASPQSYPTTRSVAAGKKCVFWPMVFCHNLKRKLFHHETSPHCPH